MRIKLLGLLLSFSLLLCGCTGNTAEKKNSEMRIFRKVTARLYMQTGGISYIHVFSISVISCIIPLISLLCSSVIGVIFEAMSLS